MILLYLWIHLSSTLNVIEILDPMLKLGRSFRLGVYIFILLNVQGPLLLMMGILDV